MLAKVGTACGGSRTLVSPLALLPSNALATTKCDIPGRFTDFALCRLPAQQLLRSVPSCLISRSVTLRPPLNHLNSRSGAQAGKARRDHLGIVVRLGGT